MQIVEPVEPIRRPFIVGVGGFSSDVGKTGLLCDLLREFPGAEAIKTTRGHHRSCGKDPHACCVSDLLGENAVLRSGREQTYTKGKDTGKYWDAGAANVHWVIATDEQVHVGVREALGRVQSDVVFIEGNSFTQYIDPDLFVMVIRVDKMTIKKTARNALNVASAIYLSGEFDLNREAELRGILPVKLGAAVPIFSAQTLAVLVEEIQQQHEKFREAKPYKAAS